MCLAKQISDEGSCVVWSQCLPTKFYLQRKKGHLKQRQEEWLSENKVFLSGDRLYADISDSLIMDAVTGSLFSQANGLCLSTTELMIDIKDKNYDKAAVSKVVMDRYL